MICDLSSVLNNEGAELRFSKAMAIGDVTDGLGITFPENVQVDGTIVCRSDVLELTAHMEGTFVTNCARCLKELTCPLSVDFSETLVQETEEIPDRDSVVVFEGTSVDLSELVLSNLLLNLSYKYLCKEDCRGICPKCGADLNEKTCDCAEDEIDPRWEMLKNFK